MYSSQILNFAMHNVLLCKFYKLKNFARTLNSRAIELAKISKNKVLANSSELTVIS